MTKESEDKLISIGLESKNQTAVHCANLVKLLQADDSKTWELCPEYMPPDEFYKESLRDIYQAITEEERKNFDPTSSAGKYNL